MPGLGKNIGDAYIEVHASTGPFRREVRRDAALAGDESGREFDRSLGSRLGKLKFSLSALKGSRNDFLNIIGGIADGFEKFFGTAFRETFASVGATIAGFGRTLADGEGPLAGFGKQLDKVGLAIGRLGGGGLDGLIIQIASVVISFEVLIGIAGPLASGVSGLAAAFTALAVGIGGALAGGILALGPGLIAAAGGVAALSVALSDLTKRQAAIFKPLQSLFKEVRESVQGALFKNAGDQVSSLVTALRPLGGLLTSLARVFSSWASDAIKAIGPGGALETSFRTLGSSLPGLLRSILNIVSGLGAGLTGLFAGATPGAERLFAAIGRVVTLFAAWANSVKGQQEINAFMQQAIDILGTLWDLAKQFGTTLSTLWNLGGAQTAEIILQDLVGVFQRLNASMSTPEGRQAVLSFFQNGVLVLRAFGPVLLSIINLFNTLDTAFNRVQFQVFLGGVTDAIGGLTKFVAWTQRTIEALSRMGSQGTQAISRFATQATAALQRFMASAGRFFGAISVAVARFVLGVGRAANVVVLAFGNMVRSVTSAFKSFNTAVGNAHLAVIRFGLNVATALRVLASSAVGSISRAISAFRGLVSGVASSMASLVGAIARGTSIAVSALITFGSRAVSALAGLGSQFFTMGINAMQGLLNGIVSRAGAVISYIGGLASKVASAFAKALGIASPSKVFRDFGGNIIDGLIDGMRRREKDAEKSGDRVAQSVISGAETSLLRARASIANTARLVTEALASAGDNPRLDKAFKALGTRALISLTNGLNDGRDAAQADVKRIIESISKVAQDAMKGEDKRTRTIITAQSKALQEWVRGQAHALDLVWREVDRAGTRLDNARQKLRDLQDQFAQVRDTFQDQLRGELNLGSTVSEEGTTTFDQVAANVSGLAAKMRTFAGLLKRLIAAGLPAALVQEVASLGTTEGIAVANALLSGTAQQRGTLIEDFASLQRSTTQIGNLLADQMFGAGIEAQKGLIKGLEANQAALIEAAKRIAKRITDEVKRELGIHSPSTVFQKIGEFITEGLARGIESGTQRVNRAVSGLVDPDAVSNLNVPISGLASQGDTSLTTAGSGSSIAAGAITVVTPFANPRLVALEVMDALAARGK